ncbi:MAG: hypothetical protein AB4372_27450 [Xenococcus sp. (in: cyanobacteria)]
MFLNLISSTPDTLNMYLQILIVVIAIVIYPLGIMLIAKEMIGNDTAWQGYKLWPWLYLITIANTLILFYSFEGSFWTVIIAWTIGIIPATIAHHKGRSFATWLCYGYLLFFVAFLHSLFASKITPE